MKSTYNAILRNIISLVGINSVNGYSAGIELAQNCVVKIAQDLGLQTKLVANGKVVLCAMDFTANKDFGFVTHIDTVPYNASEWKHSPLGELSEGWIYGRGVIDDKGATIIAMHAIARTRAKNILLIIGSSEEGEWTDMRDFLAENPKLPKSMATLDGNGVQHGCRGYADISISFENPSIKFISTPDGSSNTVPSKAIATTIHGKELSAIGVSAHSSVPEFGDNALSKLVLNNSIYFENDLLLLMSICYNPKIGLALLGMSKDSCITPTTAEIENGQIVINLNIRIGSSMTKLDVNSSISTIKKIFKDKEVKVKELILPSSIPADSKYIKYMLESYEKVLGKKTTSKIALGVGYNAALPNCCIFGPEWDEEHEERSDLCHSIDEGRPIKELMMFYEMLVDFIEKLKQQSF